MSVNEEPLCVSFINTVGARRSPNPSEYLASPGDLQRWLRKRGLIDDDEEIETAYLARAIILRDSLYRLCSSIAEGREPSEADLDDLNGELCEALAKLEVTGALQWVLTETKSKDRALMLISMSAADLLTSPTRVRIRECADAECGWIFIDHSKNRTRRWCSMSDCGNLAKARRFQARKKSAASD